MTTDALFFYKAPLILIHRFSICAGTDCAPPQ